MRQPRSTADIAWAAGLFEGEGSFSTLSANKGKYTYLRVGLQSTDPDILARFAAIIGLGKIYDVRPDPRSPNSKPIQSWQASGEDAFRLVFELFLPYLGRRRRARALELLELYGTERGNMEL